jgi:hypothetical protein
MLSIPQGQVSNPIPYQPPQDIPDSGKTPQWIIDNIRYFLTFYNQPRPSFNLTDTPAAYYGMADEMLRNFTYQKGSQQNITFKSTQMDLYNNEVQSVWIKGQELSNLVSFAVGVATELINNIEWSCKSLSDDRAELWENLQAQLKAMLQLQKDLAGTGISYNPLTEQPEQPIENEEDAQEYAVKWKAQSEINAIKITNAIYEENFGKYTILKNFLHSIVAALGSTYRYVENGRVKSEHKPSYCTIWDNRHDDPYNRQAQFYGFIDWLTPAEIYIKYPGIGKDPAKRAVIQAMASQQQGWQSFQNYWNGGMNNMSWWQYRSNKAGSTMLVAVVYMSWIGLRDTRQKIAKNRNGKERIHDLPPTAKEQSATYTALSSSQPPYEDAMNMYNAIPADLAGESTDSKYEPGDFWVPDIYQGELIGNMFLENYGLMKNVVRDPFNRSRPILPGTVFVPEMEMGYGTSLVSKAIPNQDEMDRLSFIIQDKTAADIGKVYIIDGAKLGDPSQGSVKRLITNLRRMKIHVTSPSGEAGNTEDKTPLVNAVDMTGDPNIMMYITLHQEQERTMQKIFNYSDVTLGTQQSTIGAKVQEQTLSQSSTGMLSLYDSFMEWVTIDYRYQLDLWKQLNGDKETATLIVGKEGAQVLKMTEGFQFEAMMLFIEPNDNLDKASKQRIQAIAMAEAQNQRISTLDYVKAVEMTSGKREMVKVLTDAERKQQKLAMASQQKTAEQEAMLQQQALMIQQQTVMLQKIADHNRTMEVENLRGSWNLEAVMAKLGSTIEQKIAEGFINASAMQIQKQHQMEQQATQAQLDQRQSQQDHNQQMEQNDQVHEHAMAQQENQPAPSQG